MGLRGSYTEDEPSFPAASSINDCLFVPPVHKATLSANYNMGVTQGIQCRHAIKCQTSFEVGIKTNLLRNVNFVGQNIGLINHPLLYCQPCIQFCFSGNYAVLYGVQVGFFDEIVLSAMKYEQNTITGEIG